MHDSTCFIGVACDFRISVSSREGLDFCQQNHGKYGTDFRFLFKIIDQRGVNQIIARITLIFSPLDGNRNSRNFVAQVARGEIGRTDEFNPERDFKQDSSKNSLYFCMCMHRLP